MNPIFRFFPSAIAATTGLLGFALLSPIAQAGDAAPSGEALKFFENKIRPLLAENCYGCHGEDKVKGELRLDHISAILKGAESGPAPAGSRSRRAATPTSRATAAGAAQGSMPTTWQSRSDLSAAPSPPEPQPTSSTRVAVAGIRHRTSGRVCS